MAKKMEWQDHKSNPANQPFNINGRRNLTKKKSWFYADSPNYWAKRKA